MASMQDALKQNYRNNSGFASAYPQPQRTPWKDFGNNVWDAVKYDPDPNTTWLERSGNSLMGDMNSMITGFDAQGNKIPDTLRMVSLMMPGGTGLGGKAGLGILGAATGAAPKAGSAYASRLIPALENMPQEKMSADQFSGWFGKQPVGADELEYSGIPGLLAQGGDVTKTGLLDQARANPLDIQDVVLGDHTGVGRGMRTKFSDYQLPGGKDYKEMLLTLPKGRPKDAAAYDKQLMGFVDRAVAKFKGDAVAGGMQEDIAEDLAQRVFEPDNRREYFSKAAKYLGEEDEMRAISEAYKAQRPSDFTSGHFDEPNVLSHARYNTRTIDGDKTLFVEEIQSDWHQKGRDVGYQGDIDYAALRAKQDELFAAQSAIGKDVTTQGYDATQAQQSKYMALDNEYKAIQKQLDGNANAVPNAPYKRTDKWAGLTLQRMVKEAVDSGHDRIAWTPGNVQIDRYEDSLRRNVDEITYEPNGDGTYNIAAEKNGGIVHDAGGVTPDEIKELYGKDVADKIGKDVGIGGDRPLRPDLKVLREDDLSIGGEGMKEFYDKMLVKSANKFGKKYGAKAEPTMMASNKVWTMKITPEMKAGISKGVMLGKTGGESKIGAGLLSQDNSEMTQTLQNNPYRIGDTTGINSSMMQALQGNGRNY